MRRTIWMLAGLIMLGGTGWAGTSAPPRAMAMEHVSLASKAIREVVYDRTEQRLWVLFPNGAIYTYADVPERHFAGLKSAERPGSYFHAHIRNACASTRVAPPLAVAPPRPADRAPAQDSSEFAVPWYTGCDWCD
jgi:hypothetical protein